MKHEREETQICAHKQNWTQSSKGSQHLDVEKPGQVATEGTWSPLFMLPVRPVPDDAYCPRKSKNLESCEPAAVDEDQIYMRNIYIFGHSDDQNIFLIYIWSLSKVSASQLSKPL